MVLQSIIGAVSAGALIALIAWGVSCARCTKLRELPEKPIPMEHEHGGVKAMAEYIDRQAVLDAIWPVDPENDGSDGCTVVMQNQSFTSADIEGIVCNIPAADVRQVVRARWVKQDDNPLDGNYYCEACGHGVDIATGEETPIDRDFLYCPHCGAQMDEGANK